MAHIGSMGREGEGAILPPSFVYLRLATDADMALVMAFRSHPTVYAGFFTQQKPLTWEEHKAWWESRNKDWREFIIEVQDADFQTRPVGIVTIGSLQSWIPEVGYAIGETTLWGKGVASEAVGEAVDWLRRKGYKYVHTTILDKNIASQRVCEKLGFKRVCPAREGESRWELKIG